MSVTQSDNETGSLIPPPQIVGADQVSDFNKIIRYRYNVRSFWHYPDYMDIVIWIPTGKQEPD